MKGIFRSYWLSTIRKWIAIVVVATFTISPSTTYAQTILDLPAPGVMVLQSPAFVPVVLRAIKIRPDEPLVFDFVVDNGNTGFEGEALKSEIEKIAKYFLATLTIPQKDLWVNLSPYEKDRIIADEFGQTEMGRDMLAQDYVLKQLASSLVNPDTTLGKDFWDKLYAKAQETLGTTEIPMDTFNKVWIVPEKAVIYEKDNAAILGETHLKLMMEEDYLAMQKSGESADWAQRISQQASDPNRAAAQVSSQIMREVVLPEIEKEVNTGKNFAPLRQMFSAMILATWYKEAVKDSLLAQMYENKKKISGVDIQDVNMREKIFDQYVAAYKKGVFNFIRDDKDPVSGDVLPRKYFSGGVSAKELAVDRKKLEAVPVGLNPRTGQEFLAKVGAGKPARISLSSARKPGPDQSASTRVPLSAARPRAELAMEQDNPEWDALLNRQKLSPAEQLAEDVQAYAPVVAGYWGGTAGTTPYPYPIRPGVKEDLEVIPEMDEALALQDEQSGAEAARAGILGFINLEAGASSRMNVKEAPPEVVEMNGGKPSSSKATVPVGVVPEGSHKGEVVTYQDYFMHDVAGLLRDVAAEARAAGKPDRTTNNRVIILSNEEYLKEQVELTRQHKSYGLPATNIDFVLQPLAPTFQARPQDIEDMKAKNKFASEEEYQRRLAAAKLAEEKFRKYQENPEANQKELEALFIDGDRQPGGHGELDHQLIASGEILRLIDNGIEILSVRNTDNIGGKFNKQFLRSVGAFLRNKRDFQMEFNRRAGQVGGDLVIRTDNNAKVLLEQPTLKATKDAAGKLIVEPGTSYWFNSACGLMSVRYLLSLYINHKEGQSTDQDIDDLIKELREAKDSSAKLQAIAARGRGRAQKIFDAKPSKTDPNSTVVKAETNHWQLSNNAPADVIVGAVGVWNMVDLILNISFRDLAKMSWEKLKKFIGAARFFSAKQWTLSAAKIQEARDLLTKVLGRTPDDAELMPTLETYDGNKDFVGYYLKDLFEEPHVTPGIFVIGPRAKAILGDATVTIENNSGKPFNLDDYVDVLTNYFVAQGKDQVVHINVMVSEGGEVSINNALPVKTVVPDISNLKMDPQAVERSKTLATAAEVVKKELRRTYFSHVLPTDPGNGIHTSGPIDDTTNPGPKDWVNVTAMLKAHEVAPDSGFLDAVSGLIQNGQAVVSLIKPLASLTAEQVPDDVERGIVQRLSQEFDVYEGPQMTMTPEEARTFYKGHDGKDFYEKLWRFMSEKGVIRPLVLVAKDANAQLPKGWTLMRNGEAVSTEKAMQREGGIDFNKAELSMQVERTGNGIKVHVDPAEIQRIQTGGFDGLAPIVIDVIPVRGILPALGMAEPQGAGTT